jgi:HEAT repeat protein
MVDWSGYLKSIDEQYARWWTVYTFTDVIGRRQDSDEVIPLLDLGLTVQTIVREPDEQEREQQRERPEKVEQLGVLEGLQKYASAHVLLIGRPGSGKSTALVRLLLEEAAAAERGESGKIPVLVELRYYQSSVLDLIRNFLISHHQLLTLTEIEALLVQGRFLLLIDGVNELPSEAARREVKVFRQTYPATSMMFTTRDLGVGGDLDVVRKLTMQPLTETQMRQFVKKYLPEQGDRMLRQLGRRLREFGQTPLLLWMLCSVFKENRGTIPVNLGGIFRRFTLIYDRKLKEDVHVSPESRRWWTPMLRHLAWTMIRGSSLTELQVALPKAEAEALLTEFLKNKVAHPETVAPLLLEDLLKHHLIQLGVADQIEFRHQLIQEYYAAESLLTLLPNLDEDCLTHQFLNYLKWTEPLALMLELLPPEGLALKLVRLAFAIDLKLGARLAGAVVPNLQPHLLTYITDLNTQPRLKIELLLTARSQAGVSYLSKILDHQDADVRRRAVDALGQLGSEAAIPGVVQALQHQDADVRRRAVDALGQLGSEAAISGLLQALQDQNADVRRRAVDALGQLGSEAAIPGVVQALQDQNAGVRRSGVDALGQLGLEAAIPGVVQALQDQNADVRWSGVDALGQLGSEAAIPGLLQALQDQNAGVRRSAVEGLGKIRRQAVLDPLINSLKYRGPDIRKIAAESLGNLASQMEISSLNQALVVLTLMDAAQDKYIAVRRYAAEALGKIGNPKPLTELWRRQLQAEHIEILIAISAIQERCQFYNYTLTQPPLPIPSALSIAPSPKLQASTPPTHPMHILHLSDLHFGTLDQANNWRNQLAEDLKHELRINKLDALVLSGDIANFATPDEYEAAHQFLRSVCDEFSLTPKQISLVPGNHDLNWNVTHWDLADDVAYTSKSRKRCKPDELNEGSYIEASPDVVWVRDNEKYKQRFANFGNFYQTIKGTPYPLEYDRQYTLDHFSDINLLILGLNSAWNLDHHFKSRASIYTNALSNALTEIRNNPAYKNCLKIAVWHHPLSSSFDDRITDHGFMEQLAKAGFSAFLHGHIHKSDASLFQYDMTADGRNLKGICAGTFGAPIREWVPGYPLQYNLLKLAGNQLTVETRCRRELNGSWEAHAIWRAGAGKDPLPRYTIDLNWNPSKPINHSNLPPAPNSAENAQVSTSSLLNIDSKALQKNLADLQKQGTREECREVISQTSQWLLQYPNKSYVRNQLLKLVQEKAEIDQQRQLIDQTTLWLLASLEDSDSYTLTEYLKLVTSKGLPEQGQSAVSLTLKWLEQDQRHDPYVCRNCLILARDKATIETAQQLLTQTSSWLSDNLENCDSYVMSEYLRLVIQKGTVEQKQQAKEQAATWLERSDNSFVRSQYLKLLKIIG